MKIYSTSYFRRKLADCLAQATIESVYIERPEETLILLHPVPQKDVEIIKQLNQNTMDK